MQLHPTHGSVILAFGELIQDIVVQPTRQLSYDGGHVDGHISYYRGGSGPNVAAGCAQMGIPARFLGQVGADTIGDKLINQLRGAGVDVVAFRRGATASSLSIAEPSGDTALVFDPGGSRSVVGPDIRSEHFTGVAIVHLNSHHLYSPETRDAFGAVVGHCQRTETFLSVDVSAGNRLVDYGADRYRLDLEIMKPDVLMANEKEAEILTVLDQYPKGVGMVIVHRGARPTVCVTADGRSHTFAVHALDHVADVTGGGDAFAAGYLSAILRKASLEDAIASAHELARMTVSRPGVEFPIEMTPLHVYS